MHVLLLGNKGQVGQEIEDLATTRNIKVTGFDIDSLDISDLDQVVQVFKQNTKIDIVINAAAYTNVDKAEDEPEQAYLANHEGVKNLALACKQYNKPLLHISTDYVFSGEKNGPYAEIDITEPLGIYGKSKLAGEEAIKEIWEQHVILRISWVFGKHGNNFVKKILQLAQERDTLDVVGDQFGCPTAAADVARVLLLIAEKILSYQAAWGIYNYCNAPVITWYDFATKIIEIGRSKFPLKVKQINKVSSDMFPTKTKRPKNSELLVEKIIEDYGIDRKNWKNYLSEIILN